MILRISQMRTIKSPKEQLPPPGFALSIAALTARSISEPAEGTEFAAGENIAGAAVSFHAAEYFADPLNPPPQRADLIHRTGLS